MTVEYNCDYPKCEFKHMIVGVGGGPPAGWMKITVARYPDLHRDRPLSTWWRWFSEPRVNGPPQLHLCEAHAQAIVRHIAKGLL